MLARPHWIGLAVAATAAACSRGNLREDAGGPGMIGTTGGSTGGSSGGSSIFTGAGGDSILTGAGGSQNCGAVRLPATPASLDLLVLLDASGSMSDDPSGSTCGGDCGAQSKWAQMAAAIDTVAVQTDSYVNWGLMLFGNFGTNGCTVGSYPTVAVAPANAGVIASAFAARQNPKGGPSFSGSTPTRLAVDSAAGYFGTLLDGNRQVSVLVTDGVPNCSPDSSDPAADDSAQIGPAIAFAAQAGNQTVVVGVGSLDDPTRRVLDEMAVDGGFPPPTPISPLHYYPVSTTADMAATLTGLIARNSGCLFALPYPPNDTATRSEIDVMIDGTVSPHDPSHTNGWDYADPGLTHLQFFGAACDATMPPGAHTVTIDFLCLLGI